MSLKGFLLGAFLATPLSAQEFDFAATEVDFTAVSSETIDAVIVSAVSVIEGNTSDLIASIDERTLKGNQFERERERKRIADFVEAAPTKFNSGMAVKFDLPIKLGSYDFETGYYSFCMPSMFYANGFDLKSSPNLLIVLSPENAPPEERGNDNICSPKGLDGAIGDKSRLFPLKNAPATEAQSRWAKVYMSPQTAETFLGNSAGGLARLSGKCQLQEGSWGEAYGVKRRSGVDCWLSEGEISAGNSRVELVPYYSRQIVFPTAGDYPLRKGDWVMFVIESGKCFYYETAEKPTGVNAEFDWWWEVLNHPERGKYMAAFTPALDFATLRMRFLERGETYKDFTC